MASSDRYASILNTVLEIAKERGLAQPGSEIALLCNELIEAAIDEAAVRNVDLADIGLAGFDPDTFLHDVAP